MPILAFSHYNLRATRPDLDVLRDFYLDVVGLRLGDRPAFTSFGYWLYAGERAVLHLSETRPGEQRGSSSGFDHAAFDCSDRASYERLLTARGIAYTVAEVPLTSVVQIFFKDPGGNGVELNFSSV